MLRMAFLTSCFLLLTLAACASAPIPTPTSSPAPTIVPAATATAEMGCSIVDAKPTQETPKGLPPVTSADFARGPENSTVTLLAYCDFQSAQCDYFNRVLDQLQKDHPDDLRVVMRPFPVPTSVVATLDKSQLSTQAAVAAANQGKFWEMRDLLHAQYNSWSKLPPGSFKQWIIGQAASIGLDKTQFGKDLASAETIGRVEAMYSDATKLGVAALPTVFINGTLQQRPALSYDGLNSTIGLVALGDRQFSTCPPFKIDPAKQYTATLHTAKGDIVMQLYAQQSPLAVNSFVFLSRQGWFNGVTFHRVIPGFVAQAGDPSGTGAGGPGYYFNNEASTALSFDKPGVVGMANSGPDTNGSQIFITYAPQPQLDGIYTIFGQVTKGMYVVEALTQRDPQLAPDLPPGDKIISVTIEEK
jgi:cyclophilin family peptidyl-prolyl cis-trans isomerase/protein-disulfide isomerase